MKITSLTFEGSFPSVSKAPEGKLPEYAFIGRSNVGKSSLINMLTHRKELAKVSSTPGKTQMINFFRINDMWNLVDLPGYGYAKLSKKHRDSLEKMIKDYLTKRPQLVLAFVLIDSRIPLQEIDRLFINWLGKNLIPFAIVFTKTDQLKKMELQKNLSLIKEKLLEEWTELPQTFITSAVKRKGREALLSFIDSMNSQIVQN